MAERAARLAPSAWETAVSCSPNHSGCHAAADAFAERARGLLLRNLSEGYSPLLRKRYCFIQPSTRTYPYQFWWDTCFHVFILCRLGEAPLAQRTLRSLFAMQEANGFVGHMTFWKKIVPTHWSDVLQARPTWRAMRPHMSALIQPSLVAQALERVHETTQDIAFVREMLPAIKRYFAWLAQHRDFEGDGLISIISPVESGMDFKASYDEAVGFADGKGSLRLYWLAAVALDGRNFLDRYDLSRIYRAHRFVVQDVLVNTFYALDLRALARLCRAAGDPDAPTFEARAQRVVGAMLAHMFDARQAVFFDTCSPGHRRLHPLTFTSLVPMLLAEVPDGVVEQMVHRYLLRPGKFACPYPVPSLSIDEPAFDPGPGRYLWRGPTWAAANWTLYRGCAMRGHTGAANAIRRSLEQLVQRSGFREYYDPFSGEGYGAREFTWSALIVDMV